MLFGYGIPDFSSALLALSIPDQEAMENSFEIYPNPVLKSAQIRWDRRQASFEWLELIDMQGRILLKEKLDVGLDNYTLQLEDYGKGIYLLRLGNFKQNISKRIIKID